MSSLCRCVTRNLLELVKMRHLLLTGPAGAEVAFGVQAFLPRNRRLNSMSIRTGLLESTFLSQESSKVEIVQAKPTSNHTRTLRELNLNNIPITIYLHQPNNTPPLNQLMLYPLLYLSPELTPVARMLSGPLTHSMNGAKCSSPSLHR